MLVIFPNDVKRGELVNTADGTTFRVMDNKKGISRRVQDIGNKDSGVSYVGKVHNWKAKDATSGIVGRDKDGQPTVVLMPMRRAT